MKIDISVELDWLDEDGNIDTIIKDDLIRQVSDILLKKQSKEIIDCASSLVNAKLNSLVTETYNQFLDKEITVTDNWGEVQGKATSIVDLLKRKLDNALNEKVDSSGRPSTYDHGITRLDFLINTRVTNAVKNTSEKLVKEVNTKIEQCLTEEIKRQLSSSLLAKIDVADVVKNTLGALG